MVDRLHALLAPLDPVLLDRDPSTIYLVDPALRIVFVNRSWHAFAPAQGASWPDAGRWGVGSHVLDAVSPDLRPFYARLFAEAVVSGEAVEHVYECSSPTRRRRYQMRLLPCREGHVLAVHSLVEDGPSAGSFAESDADYRSADGFVTQCSHCRRVRRVGASPPRWDWVAAYVADPPVRTSHGLCPVCLDYYYAPP